MTSKLVAEFKSRIASALKKDASHRELIGFIGKKIPDQTTLLDCLWVLTTHVDANSSRFSPGEQKLALAIFYCLFSQAVKLANRKNDLADFVLYVGAPLRERRSGKKDKWKLQPPATVTAPQYSNYQNRWSQLTENERNVLTEAARTARQTQLLQRTLISDLKTAYERKNQESPTLEQLYDFDPAPNTSRKELDAAIAECERAWRQFGWYQKRPAPPTEDYLKQIDRAFIRFREVLIAAGDNPLAFYQMWKWVRDGCRRILARTGLYGEKYFESGPSWSIIGPELYLECCYCAIRLGLSKWNMGKLQLASGLSKEDSDFMLNPINPTDRDNFSKRLKLATKNTVEFEEIHRLRRRMNRFAETSAILKHLDEFQAVDVMNTVAKMQQSDPEKVKNMIVVASSQWVAFRDKHRIGQAILDSFTIVWLENVQGSDKVIVEFHNLPYQLFSTSNQGLGELVRSAVWRKMQELSDQIIQFLLAYLEIVGWVVDVATAGTAGGFRRVAFEFIKERIKEKATDEILDAFHIENQALRTLAGITANAVPGPKVKFKGDVDPNVVDPNQLARTQARGLPEPSQASPVGGRGIPDDPVAATPAIRGTSGSTIPRPIESRPVRYAEPTAPSEVPTKVKKPISRPFYHKDPLGKPRRAHGIDAKERATGGSKPSPNTKGVSNRANASRLNNVPTTKRPSPAPVTTTPVRRMNASDARDFLKAHVNSRAYSAEIRQAIEKLPATGSPRGLQARLVEIDKMIRDHNAFRANQAIGAKDAKAGPFIKSQRAASNEGGLFAYTVNENELLSVAGRTKTGQIVEFDSVTFRTQSVVETKMTIALRTTDELYDQMRKQAEFMKDWKLKYVVWEIFDESDVHAHIERLSGVAKKLLADNRELGSRIRIRNPTTEYDLVPEPFKVEF